MRVLIDGKPYRLVVSIDPAASRCFEGGYLDTECLKEHISVSIVPEEVRRSLEIEIGVANGRRYAVARLVTERGASFLGRWWIESADGKRYKPLKPMPPLVAAIVQRLAGNELERVAMFLLTADAGDKIVVELRPEVLSDAEPT